MNDPDQRPSDSVSPDDDPAHRPPSAVRRGLLVAMPSILSLHSGLAAATARSSNVLVLADGIPDPDENGNYLCVEKPHDVERFGKGYDLGDRTEVEVTDIPADRQHYKFTGVNEEGNHTYSSVSAKEMCDVGGDYYYDIGGGQSNRYSPLGGNRMNSRGNRDGRSQGRGIQGLSGEPTDGSKEFSVTKGALVSATALASFTGRLTTTAKTWL